MENEEDLFGDHLIKPTSFYSGELEKTKLNWFCYELALSFNLAISSKVGEKFAKKYGINEEEIADFSIYFAKKMKEKMNIARCLMKVRSLWSCQSFHCLRYDFPLSMKEGAGVSLCGDTFILFTPLL